MISEGNIIQTVTGRNGWLSGVEEHGMQSKVIKRTWDTLLVPRIDVETLKVRYHPTSINARKVGWPIGSQMDRSTDEAE